MISDGAIPIFAEIKRLAVMLHLQWAQHTDVLIEESDALAKLKKQRYRLALAIGLLFVLTKVVERRHSCLLCWRVAENTITIEPVTASSYCVAGRA